MKFKIGDMVRYIGPGHETRPIWGVISKKTPKLVTGVTTADTVGIDISSDCPAYKEYPQGWCHSTPEYLESMESPERQTIAAADYYMDLMVAAKNIGEGDE